MRKKQVLVCSFVSVGLVFFALFHLFFRLDFPDQQTTTTIIYDVRLPRMLCGMLTGALLSWSGLVTQSIFRNPLASPSVVGCESAASCFAVLGIYFGVGSFAHALTVFSVLGSVLALLIVALFARFHILWALLAGFAMNAFCNSLSSFTIALSADDFLKTQRMQALILGSLQNKSWSDVVALICICIFAIIFLYRMAASIDLLTQGDEIANSLGLSAKKYIQLSLAGVAILVASAVAFGAPLPFVGLIIPQITRRLMGVKTKDQIFLAAISGGCIVIIADIIAKYSMAPRELETGVIFALIGAPFFVGMLLKNMKRTQS